MEHSHNGGMSTLADPGTSWNLKFKFTRSGKSWKIDTNCPGKRT